MRIEALLASPQQESRAGARLLLDADNSARLGNVRVGDVLQGRITRDLGQGQWLVRLEQGEVTVGSQTPLNVGDVLKGRVREVGKQVVLERLPQQTAPQPGNSVTTNWPALIGSSGYAGMAAQLRSQQTEATVADPRRPTQKDRMAAASALMSRLGFSRTRDVEMRLSQLLTAHSQEMLFEDLDLPGLALTFDPAVNDATENAVFIGQFAQWLQHLSNGQLSAGSSVSLGQVLLRLLNVQTLDTWGHLLGAGRLSLDGDIGSLLLAAFDNGPAADGREGTPFQAASLTFEHAAIGSISFSLAMAQQRLQLAIAVSDETLAEALRQSVPALSGALAALGVTLDDCVVGTQTAEGANWAAESVVDVMLRAGVLDRRI